MSRTKIPNQTIVWNSKHTKKEHEKLRYSPSPLSEIAKPYFPNNSSILELGCGVGRDAVVFQRAGHSVVATDSSEVAIDQNTVEFSNSGVDFKVIDMQDLLPYSDQEFDVVYANLSLHYYLNEKTREIVSEIERILKNGGIFAFACKSHDAQRTDGADVIEPDVYVAKSGHATHMFSTDYAKSLLEKYFDITYLDEVDEEYLGRVSGIVRCIAVKNNIGKI